MIDLLEKDATPSSSIQSIYESLDLMENQIVLGLKDISHVQLVEAVKMQDLFLDLLNQIRACKEK